MYLGFINYSSNEHYHWICRDWKEMKDYCKTELKLIIPKEEQDDYFSFLYSIIDPSLFLIDKDGDKYLPFEARQLEDAWISIQKASDYSINQTK